MAAWMMCNSSVGFLENKGLPPGHADVVERFFLSNQKGHAVTLHFCGGHPTEIFALDCDVFVALQALLVFDGLIIFCLVDATE